MKSILHIFNAYRKSIQFLFHILYWKEFIKPSKRHLIVNKDMQWTFLLLLYTNLLILELYWILIWKMYYIVTSSVVRLSLFVIKNELCKNELIKCSASVNIGQRLVHLKFHDFQCNIDLRRRKKYVLTRL